jgi:DNA-directed RNA polymerase subunit RPC12/RpoP
MAGDKVLCPNCGSANIHAEKRGWTLMTGMIGSRKIFITCLKCGRKFKPGQGIDAVEHAVSDAASGTKDTATGMIVLAVIAVVGFVLLKTCS